ncbi:hypothetical protein AAF712_012052 [Marasmius tenuissimus]|uniref:C2H2-type domain-containing protein n=1 Tax=Marasmius tenuissimus TaxID=585030 RepID=A0ABR2ZIT6_9AGAR
MRAMYTDSLSWNDREWKLVAPEEAAEAIRDSREADLPYWDKSKCGHCETLFHDSGEIMQHMKVEHDLAECTARDLILYIDTDLTSVQHRYVPRVPPHGASAADAGAGDTGDKTLQDMFGNEFLASVTSHLEDLDDQLFRPDGDINFERDFGQWFNHPDDVSALDLK